MRFDRCVRTRRRGRLLGCGNDDDTEVVVSATTVGRYRCRESPTTTAWSSIPTGKRLLSRRVANDEAVLLELISAVTALADGGEVTWAIDLNHGGAALLITLAASPPTSGCSTSLAAPSTTPRVATAATARPTPRTPR